MKKLFLIAVVVVISAACMNFNGIAVPVANVKKIIEDLDEEGMASAMPLIKVMTYNIHRGINKDNKLDLDGIAEVIKSSGADIIALQEVERFSVRTGFRDQIEYIADKLSMQYAYGKSINILNGQYGNAILSKFPIIEYKMNRLPSQGEQRTILKAGLNVNGNSISFYSTHLGLSQSERDLQVQEIVRLVEDDNRFIIAGDFNSEVDKLKGIFEKCRDSASIGDNGGRATFEENGLSGRIDYIFVSNNFDVKEYDVLESDASDHYPVTCLLELIN